MLRKHAHEFQPRIMLRRGVPSQLCAASPSAGDMPRNFIPLFTKDRRLLGRAHGIILSPVIRRRKLMITSLCRLPRWAVAMILFTALEARATQLTFDIYTNAAKAETDRAANNIVVPPAYGDNVSDFDPSTPVSGQYFRYGTNGGFTPHITLEYRFWNNPGDNGGANGRIWTTGYGNLTNVLYPT